MGRAEQLTEISINSSHVSKVTWAQELSNMGNDYIRQRPISCKKYKLQFINYYYYSYNYMKEETHVSLTNKLEIWKGTPKRARNSFCRFVFKSSFFTQLW